MTLYPLKFQPIAKEKLWGGNRLKQFYPVTPTAEPIGELWTLSSYPQAVSVVANGYLKDNELDELIEVYMGELVGDKIYEQFGNTFPLIVKLIDANDNLSLQVHPTDDYAQSGVGKTEFWYVINSDDNASVIYGLKEDTTREQLLTALQNENILQLTNQVLVAEGDALLINSGTIHSLCKGTMVVEVQQCSDETYRLWDYGRLDSHGQPRELHIEDALNTLTYTKHEQTLIPYRAKVNGAANITQCQYFTVNKLEFNRAIGRDYAPLDSFVVYVAVEGDTMVEADGEQVLLRCGETMLIPASLTEVILHPLTSQSSLLEVYM